MSQEGLGSELGTSQQAVTKMESATDPRLSTIRRFVEAVGRATGQPAAVEVSALLGKERLVLDIAPTGPSARAAKASASTSAATGPAAWRQRAWDDPAVEQVMLDESFLAVSADELGDLTHRPSREQLWQLLRDAPALADRGDQAIGTFATYWDIFINRIRRDDLVIVSLTGNRFAIGRVTGDYRYDDTRSEVRLRHQRPAHWLVRGASRKLLPDDIRKVVNAPGTICALNAPDAAARLAEYWS